MGYFKIKNITNLLPKRHTNKDSVLEIDFSSGFLKKSFSLRVNKEVYIEAGNLPINIHKLRMKEMISVVEISKNDFFKKQKPTTKKTPSKKVLEVIETQKKSVSTEVKKKRNYKKKVETE